MRIVLTGGPSAGKTAMMETFALTHAAKLSFAPEAAAILLRGGFPRTQEPLILRSLERAIFHLQREMECIAEIRHEFKPVLCDRGSLDCLAYWPGAEAEFFAEIGSSRDRELDRYDCIIHLEPSPPLASPLTAQRCEDEDRVFAIDERIKEAWRLHPNRVVVPSGLEFMRKVEFVSHLLDDQLTRKRSRAHEFTSMA